MVVRAAGDKAQPLVQQRLGQHAGVLCDILLIFFEFRLQCFAEAHGLGRDDMLQRAAWVPGKIALSMALAYSSRHRIRPPRGPRSVLWVVVVTTSA